MTEKENIETMKKCLLCKKQAKFVERSPDGKPDYFCSLEHFEINRDYLHAKGFAWRALPLEELDKSER